MAKFRKKPVVIEAYQMTQANRLNSPAWPAWLTAAWNKDFEEVGALYPVARSLLINTLEGSHVVSDGDYIIRGIANELYPCKPDIFAATYEAVTD